MLKSKHSLPAAIAALLVLTILPGCFTGIEKTATIKDNSQRIATRSVNSDSIADKIQSQPPREWASGKIFIVATGRPELAYTPASKASGLHRSDSLLFVEFKSIKRLSGDSITEVSFHTLSGDTLSHSIETSLPSVLSAEKLSLPFIIDMSMIDSAKSQLIGRKLWTRTTTRYTLDGKLASGKKFVPIQIVDVKPGQADYPLEIIFREEDNTLGMLLMVIESKAPTARTFANLFSTSDPRKSHPTISNENWKMIQNGNVTIDMTREECRLALGSPASVERDATYGGIIERWTYENGIYLIFTDGVLTRFRK